jgi:hypothetical protein
VSRKNAHPNGKGGHEEGQAVNGKVLHSWAGKNKTGAHLWYWTCPECLIVWGPSTVSHLRRSVMCRLCANQPHNNGRWKGHRDLTGVWLTAQAHNASRRGHSWDVTPEYLWQVWVEQRGRCIYTGWELLHGHDASLDRIDNTKGYEVGNVQWVHRQINLMKGTMTEYRFLELCRAVSGFDSAIPTMLADFSAGRL